MEPAGPADLTIMRTNCVRVLLLALVLALLPGCKSVKVYATRAAVMRDANAPRLITFEPGEQPAIVVDLPKHCMWGQKVGTVWVEEAITGRSVWHVSEFMRQGSKYYFVPEDLKSGTYVATLRAEGEPVASMNFDVQ
jgi:hypothetical protein